jgi:hypothetical protein
MEQTSSNVSSALILKGDTPLAISGSIDGSIKCLFRTTRLLIEDWARG